MRGGVNRERNRACKRACVCLHVHTHTHLECVLLESYALIPVPRVGAPVVVVPDVGVEGQAAGHAQDCQGDGEGLHACMCK